VLKLFRRRISDPETKEHFKLEEGLRIYAIGDIHGRADLLAIMADLLRVDLQNSPCPEVLTIFLGDYVDRGPDSPTVLQVLSAGRFPTPAVFLRGNHEVMLLRFLEEPEAGSEFFNNGGIETIFSYGVDVAQFRLGRNYEQAAEALRKRLPREHLQFIRDTKPFHISDGYFFCHAGVRPGIPLQSQREADLCWIREPFLSASESFGKLVVHGHTPVQEPEIRRNRINIDTGAYLSGRLTCLKLEGDQRSFIATR
jgi:serine/threonine protein phosphatase 1